MSRPLDSKTAVISEEGYAHELANAFTGLVDQIGSALEIARRPLYMLESKDLGELRNYLEIIAEAIRAQQFEALNLLSHHFPDFAMGLMQPRLRRVNLSSILREMIAGYSRAATEWGINFKISEGDSIRRPILVEEWSVRRAFHNVLSNALKYSYRSGPTAHRFIKVNMGRHDSGGTLWSAVVENYGVGILPEELGQVSLSGFRGRLAQEDNRFGAGLGLSEVQKCMDHHGGWLEIESCPTHEGTYLTKVRIILPVATGIRRKYPNVRIMD